jgi:hypothetical protein
MNTSEPVVKPSDIRKRNEAIFISLLWILGGLAAASTIFWNGRQNIHWNDVVLPLFIGTSLIIEGACSLRPMPRLRMIERAIAVAAICYWLYSRWH